MKWLRDLWRHSINEEKNVIPEYVPNDQGVKFAKEMESLKEKKKKDSLQHTKLEVEADFSWKNLFINTLKKGLNDNYETKIHQLKNL